MEKRKLSALPRPEATAEMVEMADRLDGMEHIVTAELVDDNKILLLNFYEVSKLKKGKTEAAFRTFLSSDDYITQDLSQSKVKWLTAAFDNMQGFRLWEYKWDQKTWKSEHIPKVFIWTAEDKDIMESFFNMFKELPLHTVISRKELLDAMVRAKMCTAEKCPVKFEIAGSQLGLSIKDQTTDYHETVDLQENISEELTIGFDARLVIETLKAFDCDNVGISLQSPKMPMIIEAEDSDFKTIVLPVAIK